MINYHDKELQNAYREAYTIGYNDGCKSSGNTTELPAERRYRDAFINGYNDGWHDGFVDTYGDELFAADIEE